MKWLLAAMAMFAFAALAADVNGTWKGKVETPTEPRSARSFSKPTATN